MNKKGFTLVELLVVIAIIAIIAGVMWSQVRDAMGADLRTLYQPTEAVINDIAGSIKNDPNQTVVVMVYSAVWNAGDWSSVDKDMDKMKQIIAKLYDLGVPKYQIITLLANKGGLELDSMPTPATDGVYLYLE